MSDEDVISLSDPDSEGEGPGIRPPQAKKDEEKRRKHREERKGRHREERDEKRRRRREDESVRERDREHRRREDRGGTRDRREERDHRDGRSRSSGDNSDLRHRLNRDRDRGHGDRHVVEREKRDGSRGERSGYSKDKDADLRMNKFIRANEHMKDSRRDVDARKKRKQIEKEMMKLQAKISSKVGRSRSGSKDAKERASTKRKSESGEESMEGDSDEEEAGSVEDNSEEGDDSEEESGSEAANSDATTGSQKSEETPERGDESEEGEVEDDELETEYAKDKSQSRSKSPKEEATGGGNKSRWADRSPSGERTPSRSPTPLRDDLSPQLPADDTPPGSGRDSPMETSHSRHMSPAQHPPAAPAPALKVPDPPVNRFPSLPPYLPSVHGCRSVAEFKCMNRIEEGTYGVVYRARDKRTQEIVALKKLKMEREKEGFPITSLREINTLLISQHVNVVTVREIVVGSNMDQIFIVMDFVQHDLKGLMETMRKKNQVFLPGEVKCLMQQLLRAIHHLHDNWILHRDLKASNLLLSHNGILKVGDFGLAREYGSPLKNYTAIVVTLWYRAPELLLGVKQYSTHIDVWSIGCILGELLMMEPLFPGKSEVDELNKIFKLLGTPSEKIWPGYKELPGVRSMKFIDFPVSKLREKFPERMLTAHGLDLMKGLLTYDPRQRTTCSKALEHPWFDENPRPIDPSMFPTWPAKSEQDPGAKNAASPKPPSGGGAFKNIDDDEARVNRSKGFDLIAAVKNNPPAAGWNLKF